MLKKIYSILNENQSDEVIDKIISLDYSESEGYDYSESEG